MDDFDRTLAALDVLRRRMDRSFDEDAFEANRAQTSPHIDVVERADGFRLDAELPGLAEADVDVSVHDEVVTVSGERKGDAPAGWSVHRQERGPYKFSRSFALGTKIDAERVTASMKDGVLTVFLPRLPESQPRRVRVQRAERGS